jgi:ABC-type sugar transport system ATPase subunit
MLRLSGLTSPGKFSDIGFSVRSGEVVGLAGLVGAGRTEIAEAVFGLDRAAQGDVYVSGKLATKRTPAAMMRLGVGLVPEDRKRNGLVLMMNARENISLPTLPDLATASFVNGAAERALAKRYFELMRVKAPSTDSVAEGLSGGNQQKLVMAKWLAANCDILILDEPTRGVDVGTKSEIQALIRQLAADGKAVLVISSELPELLAVSSRILAVRNGRIAGEMPAAGATEEALMSLMTGVSAA